ncbi:hypothetical protein M3Y98_01205300 [Aphelenchoides besseyi]|nr:hypothetical protein M3Y98_01205300 [Aphelenchoides besseyi]
MAEEPSSSADERNTQMEKLAAMTVELNEKFGNKTTERLIGETDFSAVEESNRLNTHKKLFNDSIAMIMKILQQKKLSDEETDLIAQSIRSLIFLGSRRTIFEIFKLLSVNFDLIQNFNKVFERIRPCFEMKIPVDSEDIKMNICTFVLKVHLNQALMKENVNEQKNVCVLIRQLTRSIVKVIDEQKVVTQRSIVSTADLIRDVLFALPLNPTNCELILNLLNHFFGTGCDSRVHLINWGKNEDETFIRPSDLLAFMLLVYKHLNNELPSRTGFPIVFRQLGNRLQRDKVVIPEDELLFYRTGIELVALAVQVRIGQMVRPELPEVLVRYMKVESRRLYRKVYLPKDHDDCAPIEDFFTAILELSVVAAELAREMLKEMRQVICFPDSNPTILRLTLLDLLMSNCKQQMAVESWRCVVPVIEDMIRAHNWPLDLIEKVRTTPMIFEIAIKNELLMLLGTAAFMEIAVREQESTSGSTLANCFATETYRILSELFATNIEEQTNTRTRQCYASMEIINAIRQTACNAENLARKLSHTSAKSDVISNCCSGLTELFQRLDASEQTIAVNWSLESIDQSQRV